MSNIVIAFFAYFIDRVFGEFRFIKHPVVLMGSLISFFERKFYKDTVSRGVLLVLFVLIVVGTIAAVLTFLLSLLDFPLDVIVTSLIASMFLAHRMLYESVKKVIECEDKKEAVSELVSRDVEKMSDSDVYKAAVETYAENLSDGVIAPFLYLLLFGLPGIIIYKVINTMDSMVGYRNEKYENYGKAAAILDDIANYIPARLSAMLIMMLGAQKNIFGFYKDGSKHDSPNAGHPITAMAKALDVRLGGDTYYFGELKKKPYFGKGREEIGSVDVINTLTFRTRVDVAVFVVLVGLYLVL